MWKNSTAAFFLAFMVVVGGSALVSRWWNAPVPLEEAVPPLETKHLVDDKMRGVALALEGRPAPSVSALGPDGTVYGLEDLLSEDRPALLVFVKDKCPCSAAFEPYAQQVFRAYGDKVAFYGVIDGGPEVAQAWTELHKTPYPLLMDPKLELVHDYGVTNSAFVVLINREKVVERAWPGYSVALLEDLGATLARTTGAPAVPFVWPEDAPVEPYAGCPFD